MSSDNEVVFNIDMMNDENFKRVIKEIIRDIQNKEKEIPLDMYCEQLRLKYQITDHPEMDLSQSLWVQCVKDIQGFTPMLQGHKLSSKQGGKVRVPIYSYTVDAEQGDVIIKKIVENFSKNKHLIK